MAGCRSLVATADLPFAAVYRLGVESLQNDRVTVASVLFIITSPASIHHSMLYTHATLLLLSISGCLQALQEVCRKVQ